MRMQVERAFLIDATSNTGVGATGVGIVSHQGILDDSQSRAVPTDARIMLRIFMTICIASCSQRLESGRLWRR